MSEIPKRFQDFDFIPFGKFGPESENPKKFGELPTKYLLWLWDNGIYQDDEFNGRNEWNFRTHWYIVARWHSLIKGDYIPIHEPKRLL